MKVIPFGFMGGGASGPFAPDSISDLQAWYKSDTNVTTVLNTGEERVSRWGDVDDAQPLTSGNVNIRGRLIDATHGFAAALIPPDLQNGYPYFNAGSSQYIQGLLTTPLTDPFTLVLVTRYNRGSGASYAYRYNNEGIYGVPARYSAGDSIRASYSPWAQMYATNYTTSSDTLTIATGALTVVAADDLGWTTGYVAVQADDNNIMVGTITSYTAGTKTLVLNITSATGSGTFSSWDVGGVSSTFLYTAFPQTTKWDTLINVYDGANSKSVVNGVDNGSGTMVTPMKHTGLKFIFAGFLEIIAYNKALDTDEIAELSTYLIDKYAETTFQDRWSMYFDGFDDYVDCGRVADMEVQTLSWSVWIKPGGYARNTCIFMKGSSTNHGLSMWITNSDVLVCQAANVTNDSYNNSQVASLPTYIPLNTWGHIAFTHEQTATGATQKIYINGILRNTYINTPAPVDLPYTISYPGNDLYLGQRNNGTYDYIGNMDDVAFWDTVLDEDTVESIYHLGAPNDLTLPASYTAGSGVDKSGDLKGYWLMGDGAHYNGGLGLPYDIPDAWAATLFSKSYFWFDGIDDYIDFGNDSSLRPTTAFSYSFWIKTPATTGISAGVMQNGGGPWGNRNHGIYISQYWTTYYFYIGDGTTFYTLVAGCTANVWQHFLLTYDGTDAKIYRDGGAPTTVAVPSIAYDSGAHSNFILGARGDTQFPTNSDIDDLAIFDSAKVIGDVWDGSGHPTDLSGESGLVAYWKFDDATLSGQWTVPDSSANSNTGTSVAMGPMNKKYYANTGKQKNGSLDNAKMDTP